MIILLVIPIQGHKMKILTTKAQTVIVLYQQHILNAIREKNLYLETNKMNQFSKTTIIILKLINYQIDQIQSEK